MKKQNIYFVVVVFLFLVSPYAMSQAVHEIEVVNYEFIPDSITVEIGDTVRWMSTNNQNDAHNVLADDGSFTSGTPAPAPWVYDHVFTATGENPYYCEPHGGPGGEGMSGVVFVTEPSDVTEDEQTVNGFKLYQNYPNPFNPTTNIGFQIASSGFVSLKVYDAIGKEVVTLVNEEKPVGTYEVEFSATGVGRNLSSGIYYYKLISGKFSETRKFVLLK